VAIGAGISELGPMGVVFTVAGDAIGTRTAKALVGFVAALAREQSVTTAQRKVGVAVVEGVAIETDDVCAAAPVLAMTFSAGGAFDTTGPTVEAGTGLEIRSNRVVTVETEAHLGIGAPFLVALSAVSFDVCVAFDHRTGHDQGLPVGSAGVACEKQRGERQGRRSAVASDGHAVARKDGRPKQLPPLSTRAPRSRAAPPR
jgi:hypothetical protein